MHYKEQAPIFPHLAEEESNAPDLCYPKEAKSSLGIVNTQAVSIYYQIITEITE